MEDQVYQELCQKMAKRGGRFPGMDIPEYYNLIKELFTAEEAAVFNAIPKGYHPANNIAANLERNEQETFSILEQMADKGLVLAGEFGGTSFYGITPLDNIFDFQFMRGTSTERDKKLAKLIHAYKKAVDKAKGGPVLNYPATRVIPIDRKILDVCIGCGVCATGCPEEAIDLVERGEILIPPVDQKALSEAVKNADYTG